MKGGSVAGETESELFTWPVKKVLRDRKTII